MKTKIVKVPKREGKKRKSLIEEADAWASRHVRLRDSDADGYACCYTCGSKFYITKIQCGHFVGRAHYSTRFDERNMHAQCQRCNKFRSGEPGAYSAKLIADIGIDSFIDLIHQGLLNKVIGDDELYVIINHFKELTNKALRDKKIRPWW